MEQRLKLKSDMTQRSRRRICYGRNSPPLLAERSVAAGDAVNLTSGRRWRYYTLLECGSKASSNFSIPRLCLLFKEKVKGNRIFFARSKDGVNFQLQTTRKRRWLPLFEGTKLGEKDVDEGLIAHNFAAVRLPSVVAGSLPSYAMAGGQQRIWQTSPSSSTTSRQPSGIRFARGTGWPWRKDSWSEPSVVIARQRPIGCIERRPRRALMMGAPAGNVDIANGLATWSLPMTCEFDGRLSLVYFGGAFRLFARANLYENSLTGGRFVQSTTSVDGRMWTPWQPLSFRRMPAGVADLYFFVAQINPVLPSTLMAIFPISQPPDACIALAFSKDGLDWTEPYVLQRSTLGWRTRFSEGSGQIEWRNEDHPVAGAFLSQTTREVWFYIHHAVSGMSMRAGSDAKPEVVRYKLAESRLLRLAQKLLGRLGGTAGAARLGTSDCGTIGINCSIARAARAIARRAIATTVVDVDKW